MHISLGIRPVWSESLLSAWRNIGPLTTMLLSAVTSLFLKDCYVSAFKWLWYSDIIQPRYGGLLTGYVCRGWCWGWEGLTLLVFFSSLSLLHVADPACSVRRWGLIGVCTGTGDESPFVRAARSGVWLREWAGRWGSLLRARPLVGLTMPRVVYLNKTHYFDFYLHFVCHFLWSVFCYY